MLISMTLYRAALIPVLSGSRGVNYAN